MTVATIEPTQMYQAFKRF